MTAQQFIEPSPYLVFTLFPVFCYVNNVGMISFKVIRLLLEGRMLEAAEVPGSRHHLPFLPISATFFPLGERSFPLGNSQHEVFHLSLAT